MSRAQGLIAAAVAEVIAAQISHLPHVTDAEARATGHAALRALVADGWHITALPPHCHPTKEAHHAAHPDTP